MSLTLPYPDLGPGIVDDAELDANFGAITTKFGNIDNSDVAVGASISVDKLDAQYQWLHITFNVATFIATGYKSYYGIYNDSKGDWTVNRIVWVTDDTGDATAQFAIEWGYFNAGVWTGTTIASGISVSGTANTASQGSSSASGSATFDANQRSFALRVTTLSANSGNLWVTLELKRKITAA